MGLEEGPNLKKVEGFLNEGEQGDKFLETLKDVEREVAFINAVGDELDKNSKLKALDAINELKSTVEPERRKELISDLESSVAMIDVAGGKLSKDSNLLDKDSKGRAQEFIKVLKSIA